MGIVVALLVLSLLIFFHELGHFLAARLFGVHVEVFSIGFGKRLWTKKIGQTEWSLSAIPLGGYVKMKGQDDSDPTRIHQMMLTATIPKHLGSELSYYLPGHLQTFLWHFCSILLLPL